MTFVFFAYYLESIESLHTSAILVSGLILCAVFLSHWPSFLVVVLITAFHSLLSFFTKRTSNTVLPVLLLVLLPTALTFLVFFGYTLLVNRTFNVVRVLLDFLAVAMGFSRPGPQTGQTIIKLQADKSSSFLLGVFIPSMSIGNILPAFFSLWHCCDFKAKR